MPISSSDNFRLIRDLPVDDLVRIAAAGGGIRVEVFRRTVPELTRIARAASKGGGRVTFVKVDDLKVDELVALAEKGQGCVSFED